MIEIGPDHTAQNVYVRFGANDGASFRNDGTIKVYNALNGFDAEVANYGTIAFLRDTTVDSQEIAEGTVINNHGTITVDTLALNVNGTLTNTGDGAVIDLLGVSRTTFVNAFENGATLNINSTGGTYFNNGMTNRGILNLNTDRVYSIGTTAAAVTNAAEGTINANVALTVGGAASRLDLTNSGRFNVNNRVIFNGLAEDVKDTTVYNVSAGNVLTLNVSETFNTLGGKLVIAGSSTGAVGTVNVAGTPGTDPAMTFTGAVTNSGVFNAADDSIFTGTMTHNATGVFQGKGTLTFSGATEGEGKINRPDAGDGAVIYNADGAQNVYGGSYRDLTVGGTGEKTLAAAIDVYGLATITSGAVLSGAKDVTFHAGTNAADADVGTVNLTGGTATYKQDGDTAIFGGTYYKLNISGTGTKSVDDVVVTSSISVGGSLDFTGATSGNATLRSKAGTVTYSGDANKEVNLFRGDYSTLILSGTGDRVTKANTTINVATDLQVKAGAVLSGKGNVDVKGTVTVSDGEANLTGGMMTYGEAAGDNVLGGTYYDLTLNGTTAKVLANDITVTGTLYANVATTFNGAFSGTTSGNAAQIDTIRDITFNGSTAGEVTFVANDAHNTITYGAAAEKIYGGTYYNFVNEGNKTVDSDVTVNNEATLGGIIYGKGNWTFNGTLTDAGTGSFLKNGGAVIYNSELINGLYTGRYYDLVVNGNVARSVGDVEITHELRGEGDLTFAGTTAGKAVARMSDGSTVTYGDDAELIYGGTYGNLALGDTYHSVDENLIVNGELAFDGELAGKGDVTLNGSVTGIGTMNRSAGTVSYNFDNVNVVSGTYANLTLNGTAAGFVAGATTVNGTFATNSAEMSGAAATQLTLNGAVTGTGSFVTEGAAFAGTVVYGSDTVSQSVLGGYYTGLTLNGSAKSFADAVEAAELVNSAAVTVDADVTVGTLTNNEGITVNAGSTLSFGAGSTIGEVTNNGTVEVTGGSYNKSQTMDLVNNGTIRVNGAGADVTLGDDSVSEGSSYEVLSGKLTLSGLSEKTLGSVISSAGIGTTADGDGIYFVGGEVTLTSLSGKGDVYLGEEGSTASTG